MDFMDRQQTKRGPLAEGEPFVWATGAALAITLLMTAVLLIVIMANGLGYFWPASLATIHLKDGETVLGTIMKETAGPGGKGRRIQVKIANRDLNGLDFRWLDLAKVKEIEYDPNAVILERMEYGNFYGFLKTLDGWKESSPAWAAFETAWAEVQAQANKDKSLSARIAKLNNAMERKNQRLRKLKFHGGTDGDPEVRAIQRRLAGLKANFDDAVAAQTEATGKLRARKALFADASGREKEIALIDIVRYYKPNAMSMGAKCSFYLAKIRELLLDNPRESNTEGGLFPSIFGTVMLTFLMSLFSFPFGLIAGVYLREYAREGLMVRIVRIAVNNLAGIPSIVYGIFGLAFFVYGVGGTIDEIFFPERLPTPTFGTGGLLWASLTLGLLTVPVVIVTTEEALGAIPKGVHEGAYALGATKFQTLLRVLLPMASPGIMTGFILAMARAAGEVAPLMITGVVKLAPALPIDGNPPFLHFDRKFMHLGFHIYDIGFQSPNVEAAKPMVFVTTLLLVLLVLIMSSAAIYLRNTMRRKYGTGRL